MNLFYNGTGVGDVLLCQLTPERPEEVEAVHMGDVTLLKDTKSGETVGFNLFNASVYADVKGNGHIELTEGLLISLRAAMNKNNVDLPLDADLSPKFVVGHVTKKDKHPNADKLSVCTVDIGEETLQIVCGAPNVEAGQKVVVAKVGAVMPSGMVIRDAELRGVASSGMICSAKELDLPDAPAEKGILVLSEEAVAGEAFTG